MTFGSLFAGIGGLDLGLERAGMECRWQVEIDDYASRVLAKHWPGVRRHDDVRTFSAMSRMRTKGKRGRQLALVPLLQETLAYDRVDLICGGDPCQANSAAGKSTQQSLGGEFIRIVDEFRPRLVLRENPSHVRKDAPWPWWRFRSELESLGYAVLPFRLRACCIGAQHRRERLFLLAELTGTNGDRLERRPRQTPEVETVESKGLVAKQDWMEIPADIGFNSRAGIPGYVDQVRGLGNAVVPQVAEFIGRRILEADNATA